MSRREKSAPPVALDASRFVPKRASSLRALATAAQSCRGCELYREGTQTIFGEGSSSARAFVIGEQPGDQEDRAGEPFVGPAGKLLRETLVELGIDEGDLYLTNAVKHFHWIAQGRRRLHQKPQMRHIKACRPWLAGELERVEPEFVVCLGASASAAIFGRAVTLRELRGRWVASPLSKQTLVTVHPSSILRAPDELARREARAAFARDLKLLSRALKKARPGIGIADHPRVSRTAGKGGPQSLEGIHRKRL